MATFYKRDKSKKDAPWYYRYFDENGKRISKRGCTDLQATKDMARKDEEKARLVKHGVIDAKLDRYAAENRRPISEHLEDWIQDLQSRDVTDKQVKLASGRTKRLIELAGIKRLNEVTPFAVQNSLAKLRDKGRAAKTLNDSLASLKQFCSWARADGRIPENPIDSVKGYNTATDRRHDRRALSDEEIRRLIKAAENGPTLQGCPGVERALIYRLAVLSGLRANEIGTLTKQCFNLDATSPTVTVQAGCSKHRREDIQPLPDELVPLLREHLRETSNPDRVFHMPLKPVRALRKDLEAAGIEYQTQSGFADFHALRHTFITRLINSGVNPKTAQILARHHDASLTLNTYSHIEMIDQVAALKRLPPLDNKSPEREKQVKVATGTDGKKIGDTIGTVRRLFLIIRGIQRHKEYDHKAEINREK